MPDKKDSAVSRAFFTRWVPDTVADLNHPAALKVWSDSVGQYFVDAMADKFWSFD